MEKSKFLISCEEYINSFLLQCLMTELQIKVKSIGAEHIPILFKLEDTHDFKCNVQRDQSKNKYEIKISTGVFVKLCYISELFNLVVQDVMNGGEQIHHATMIQPNEFAYIDYISQGLLDIFFKIRPELGPLFFDISTREEFYKNLSEIEIKGIAIGCKTEKNECKKLDFPKELSNESKNIILHAMRFILFHEFSHIILGHLSYLEENINLSALPEKRKHISNIGKYTSQAIEIDADISSMLYCLTGDYLKKYAGIDLEKNFRPVFFGIGVLLTVYDINARSSTHYSTSTHPIPDFRFLLSVDFWRNNLEGLKTNKNFNTAWQEAICFCKIATDQLMFPGGAFFTIGREVFVDFSKTENFKVINTDDWNNYSGTNICFDNNKTFIMNKLSDQELYKILIKLKPLQAELKKLRKDKLGIN